MLAVRQNEGYLDDLLTYIQRSASTNTAVHQSYEELFQFKGIVLETLAREREAVASGADSETLQHYERLAGYKSRLSNLFNAGPKDKSVEDYKQSIRTMEEKIEATGQGLAKTSSVIRRRLESRKLKLADIQKQIPAKSLVIDYYHFRNVAENKFHLAAFVLTRDSIEFMDLGEMAPIDTAIAEYREAVDRWLMEARGIRDVTAAQLVTDAPVAGQELNRFGERIASRILYPILEKYPGMGTLMFVPDGGLLLLPLGVLPLPDGKYVMEEYNVRYMTSVKDIVPFETPKTDRALCVGGVNYDTGGRASGRSWHGVAAVVSASNWTRRGGSRCRVRTRRRVKLRRG